MGVDTFFKTLARLASSSKVLLAKLENNQFNQFNSNQSFIYVLHITSD
jgi:hypothetical protein